MLLPFETFKSHHLLYCFGHLLIIISRSLYFFFSLLSRIYIIVALSSTFPEFYNPLKVSGNELGMELSSSCY